MSLCTMPWLCRYSRPSTSWQKYLQAQLCDHHSGQPPGLCCLTLVSGLERAMLLTAPAPVPSYHRPASPTSNWGLTLQENLALGQ